jgi:hypothetical protein
MVIRSSLLAFALFVLGCDGPRCGPIQGCDVRKKSCQRAALKLAACLRGSSADIKIDVEVIDRATYTNEAVREAMEEPTPEYYVALRAGLTLFSLSVPVDPMQDAVRSTEWVAGSYDVSENRITVIDRPGKDWEGWNTILLVHEMVHALQHHDPPSRGEPTTFEASWLASTQREGEASLVEDQALVEGLGFVFDDIDYARAIDGYIASSRDEALSADEAFTAVRSGLVYALGLKHMYEAFERGGADEVRARLTNPIAGTEELLGAPALAGTLDESIPVYEGGELLVSRHLGGVFVDLFARRIAEGVPDLMAHVADDVFSVQRLADGNLVAAWRIRFDDSVSARTIEQLLRDSSDLPFLMGGDDERDLWIVRDELGVVDAPEKFSVAPAIDTAYEPTTAHPNRLACGRRRSALAPL